MWWRKNQEATLAGHIPSEDNVKCSSVFVDERVRSTDQFRESNLFSRFMESHTMLSTRRLRLLTMLHLSPNIHTHFRIAMLHRNGPLSPSTTPGTLSTVRDDSTVNVLTVHKRAPFQGIDQVSRRTHHRAHLVADNRWGIYQFHTFAAPCSFISLFLPPVFSFDFPCSWPFSMADIHMVYIIDHYVPSTL